MELDEDSEWLGLSAWLDSLGLNPQLCDAPVPYFRNGVSAGVPRSAGDYDGETINIPRSWVRNNVVFVVDVNGDSMRDVGICKGDRVTVCVGCDFEDGDVVVADVDGECVVKSYFRDKDGVEWLLPRNSDYEPIELSRYSSVRLIGKVTGVQKPVGRMSYAEGCRILEKRGGGGKVVDDEQVRQAVMRVLPSIRNKRMWYAVYRALADCGYVRTLLEFEHKINSLFPGNDFGVRAEYLSYMAVNSFRKSVGQWNEDNAPVKGRRFEEYLAIAERMLEYLCKR